MKTAQELHKIAVDVFKNIVQSAVNHRHRHNQEICVSDFPVHKDFYPEDGICANLHHIAEERCSCQELNILAGVKNHIVSIHPEFSGSIDYPVKIEGSPANAHDLWHGNNDKWIGEYGAARLRMAEFALEWLEKADDSVIEKWFVYKTPFARKGYLPTDLFELLDDNSKDEDSAFYKGAVLKLKYDDDSSNPRFVAIGTDSDRYIDISRIKKIDPDNFGIEEAAKAAKAAKKQLEEIEELLKIARREFAVASASLALHGLTLI